MNNIVKTQLKHKCRRLDFCLIRMSTILFVWIRWCSQVVLRVWIRDVARLNMRSNTQALPFMLNSYFNNDFYIYHKTKVVLASGAARVDMGVQTEAPLLTDAGTI